LLTIVYYGEYSIPSTTGLTSATTNGCFVFPTQQQGSETPPTFLAVGQGLPAFAPPYPAETDAIAQGPIASFTITNLTRTSGTGTFTLDTQSLGVVGTASGTVTITGSTAFYSTDQLGVGSVARKR
jgi:hypothetical protein